MKKSVKVFFVLALAVLLFSSVTMVNAATEEELIAYLSKSFNIAGQSVKIPSGYVKEAQRYINTYGITPEEADQVIAKIDEGVQIMREAGVADINALPKEAKQELLSTAQEAAAVVGATLTYSKGGVVTVTGEDGKTFGTFQVISKNVNTFAQTGSDYMVYAIAGVTIIAIAGLVVVYRKNKANA